MAQVQYHTQVYCTLQVEGIHNWKDCPIEEVSYLRDPHRHIFHIKAFKAVTHDDRDVEFIVLKHDITKYLRDQYWSEQYQCLYFGSMSCEMIGKELADHFSLTVVEVSEDNENGAVTMRYVVEDEEDLSL